jgi:rod shape-determining protein MreD
MRWLPYFILAYITLGVQIGLRDYGAVRGAAPNIVLMAVVFIAINAPRDTALLGCFILGLLQDLMTTSPLGLWALAYGLVGMVVVSTQEIVYREHFLTHASLALVGGLLCDLTLVVHGWFYPMLHHAEAIVRPSVATLLAGTVYTALLAPLGIGVMQRTRRFFAFRPTRAYSMRRGFRTAP